ncbi:MAG: hypothetical protein QW035_03285 [Candidatus Anstonellales archaeon]
MAENIYERPSKEIPKIPGGGEGPPIEPPDSFRCGSVLAEEKWFEKEIMSQIRDDPKVKRMLAKFVGEVLNENISNLDKITMAEYAIKYLSDPLALKREEFQVLMAFNPDEQIGYKIANNLLDLEIAIEANAKRIEKYVEKKNNRGEYLTETDNVTLPNGEKRLINKIAYFKHLAELRVKLSGMVERDTVEEVAEKIAEAINKRNDELKKANIGRFDAYDAGIFAKLLAQELGLESKLEFTDKEALFKIKDPIIGGSKKGWYTIKFA